MLELVAGASGAYTYLETTLTLSPLCVDVVVRNALYDYAIATSISHMNDTLKPHTYKSNQHPRTPHNPSPALPNIIRKQSRLVQSLFRMLSILEERIQECWCCLWGGQLVKFGCEVDGGDGCSAGVPR
jgi:hypothetical protein